MMRKAALCLALTWAVPLAAQDAGSLKSVVGVVTYSPASATNFRVARQGEPLRIGDYVATDFDSQATLRFRDGTEAQLQEMSQVRVDQVLLSGDRARVELYLRLGKLETLSPEAASGRTDFSVRTPTAEAWIRGTHQLVAYAEGFGTRVEFLRGFGFTKSAMGRAVNQYVFQKSRVGMDLDLTGPELYAKQQTVPDFTPHGRDSDERRGARDYNRLTIAPPRDVSSPNSGGDLVRSDPHQSSSSSYWYPGTTFQGPSTPSLPSSMSSPPNLTSRSSSSNSHYTFPPPSTP